MYCYRSTCTNDKGDALVGWRIECVQNANLTTPVTIYSDESLTPIAAVSGVSNRAVSDKAGNFFFFVPDGLYGLRYYDSAGIFQRAERFFSMYGTGSIGSAALDADGTLAANSDANVATQKAVKTYADTKFALANLDTDTALTANSDSKVASQKATKTYVDTHGREKLASTRNYYVRTDGSDSNTGLSNTAGGAFLTIQKAIKAAYALDLNGFVVIINVADGTYTGAISVYGTLTGATDSQPLRLIGNEATPANVLVSVTGGNALSMGDFAYLLVGGIEFRTTTSGNGWLTTGKAILEHRNCRLGDVANDMIIAQHHSVVKAVGPLTVAGSASSFCHVTKRAIIDFSTQTIVFSGSPVFSTYLWGINDASVNLDSGTITGTATGRTFVHASGILNASSLTGSYLGGIAPVVFDTSAIMVEDLFVNRTLFVRTDGNDANDGLANTAARAFKTITAAVNYLAKLPYDPLAWAATPDSGFVIQVAPGTYAETVNLRDIRFAGAMIKGDELAPGNVIVAGVTDGFYALNVNTRWYVRGVKITASAGSAIRAEQGAQINFRFVDFGTCSSAHVNCQSGSRVVAEGDYWISGGASWHKIIRTNAACVTSNRTVTITGTPAFSQAYALADDGAVIRAVSMTFSGTATGKRYDVSTNGVINVNGGGATYFPGSVAGTTATGGQYA